VEPPLERRETALQLTPRSLQSVAIRSRHAGPLPTVRFIAAREQRNERKDRTMKTISTQARLTSLVLAVATAAVVIGSTVAGMQYSAESQPALVVMEKVTVKPTAVQ
jgi:hypothetical protein